MRHLLLGFTFSLALCASVSAQELSPQTIQQAAELREQALKSDLAWDILESLTTEVGPRLAGSEADKAAVKWGVEKLTSLGFDKVWTEPVKIPV